jgi:RNA polymerase sigma-70 factor (ECF subfamily)
MTGSPCDGEDVLQDTLVLAFYRFPELRDGGSLRSWLFRIAHNKCIDFLRGKRRAFLPLEEEPKSVEVSGMEEALVDKERVERALSNLVTELPTKERACVVLKDVLDWSLEETAEITGSSVGAVKAALHRGRAKLEAAARAEPEPRRLEPRHRALIERYLAAFNRQDWPSVQALVADEARLEVVHRSEGPLKDACYFINYGRLTWRWKLELTEVVGVEAIVHFREQGGVWRPHSMLQLGLENGQIVLIRDYVHVDYLLAHSRVG